MYHMVSQQEKKFWIDYRGYGPNRWEFGRHNIFSNICLNCLFIQSSIGSILKSYMLNLNIFQIFYFGPTRQGSRNRSPN